jgi:hypothetical protein
LVICDLRFAIRERKGEHQSPVTHHQAQMASGRVIVAAVALVVIVALSMLGAAGRWIDASADRHDTQAEKH